MKFNKKYLLFLYILFSIIYIVPSLVFYNKYHSIAPLYDVIHESYFFIDTDNHELLQAFFLFLINSSLTIIFLLIVKNRKELFPHDKFALLFIFIVQFILSFGITVNSSDIYCYFGVGRLYEKYHQNPYYSTVYEYGQQMIDEGSDETFYGDTSFERGYKNIWADTRVSYGPIHVFFISAITKLSGKNIDLAAFLLKITFIIINILICIILYKLFDNNIIYSLLYGLNPFVIFHTVVNAHHESLFLLFILLSIYSLIKEKKIIKSLLWLSISVNIKFISIIFLPCFILYTCRKEKLWIKILFSLIYGIFFLEILFIPWLPFYEDLNVFDCAFDQIGRTANSIYSFIEDQDTYDMLQKTTFYIFVILYIINCLKMLLEKNFNMSRNMMTLLMLLLFFLLFATTNLQFWYLIWLFSFIYFTDKKGIVFILSLQLSTYLLMPLYICTYVGDKWILATVFCICIVYSFRRQLEQLINLITKNKFAQKKTST